ncbi:MAG TPA: ABC transporter permease [Stellaceae bacterium]|nr:ABC transporter permease [Stellaceae bacterium]
MAFYVLKRLLAIAAILAVMSVLIFLITQILPGNVAQVIAGQFASPETVAAVAHRLGLDQPLLVQYWRWASGILGGDLGVSLVMERPVAPVLFHALGNSALLAALSFVFVVLVGIGLGILAAIRHGGILDHCASIFTYVGISVPEFFWGIVLILVFARYLDWLPSGGAAAWGEGLGPWISHLVLPAATLTFTLIAHVSRLTRSSMIETLRSQYVRNARAKGLPERVVLLRHALRNALLPTITVLAIDVGWLIGGVVVVEAVFAYPGIGRLLIFAIQHHDLPLIQASILVIAAIYCLANLIADLLYAYFNPKIRYGRASA